MTVFQSRRTVGPEGPGLGEGKETESLIVGIESGNAAHDGTAAVSAQPKHHSAGPVIGNVVVGNV